VEYESGKLPTELLLDYTIRRSSSKTIQKFVRVYNNYDMFSVSVENSGGFPMVQPNDFDFDSCDFYLCKILHVMTSCSYMFFY
jgi:hypothetical protein